MNQSELEGATEKLSNLLECEDVLKWCDEQERIVLISQTSEVRTRLHHLVGALEAWKRGEDEGGAGAQVGGGEGIEAGGGAGKAAVTQSKSGDALQPQQAGESGEEDDPVLAVAIQESLREAGS